MTYIENIFICMVSPLPVLLVAAGRWSAFRLSQRK